MNTMGMYCSNIKIIWNRHILARRQKCQLLWVQLCRICIFLCVNLTWSKQQVSTALQPWISHCSQSNQIYLAIKPSLFLSVQIFKNQQPVLKTLVYGVTQHMAEQRMSEQFNKHFNMSLYTLLSLNICYKWIVYWSNAVIRLLYIAFWVSLYQQFYLFFILASTLYSSTSEVPDCCCDCTNL
jgi:hypothetical protein